MRVQSIQRVIAANTGGLSNRLKTLVSAWRMADALGAELLLFWPASKKVPMAYRQLFVDGPKEIDEAEFRRLAQDKITNVILDGWRFLLLPSDDIVMKRRLPYEPDNRRAIDFAYKQTPEKLVQDFLRYVHRIRPGPSLAQRIEDNARKFAPDSVAVHIRTWCFMGDDRPVFYRFENYLKALKRYAGKMLFVASDSPEAIEALRKAHTGEVRSLPVSVRGHATQDQIEDAACELFLLSIPPVLIGSFGSTFTEYAWWLGDCKQKVSIAEPRRYLFKYQSRNSYCVAGTWFLRDNN
jgi:hypothetical protein